MVRSMIECRATCIAPLFPRTYRGLERGDFVRSYDRFHATHFRRGGARGLVVDHLCRKRRCCNPDHLEQVTQAENIRRGDLPDATGATRRAMTHCRRGHPLSGDNLYHRPQDPSRRHCRACQKMREAACRERKRLESARDPAKPTPPQRRRSAVRCVLNQSSWAWLIHAPPQWIACLAMVFTPAQSVETLKR